MFNSLFVVLVLATEGLHRVLALFLAFLGTALMSIATVVAFVLTLMVAIVSPRFRQHMRDVEARLAAADAEAEALKREA